MWIDCLEMMPFCVVSSASLSIVKMPAAQRLGRIAQISIRGRGQEDAKGGDFAEIIPYFFQVWRQGCIKLQH